MENDEIIRHAIEGYSFLIPRGERRNAAEFGELIREYNSHPRCKIIAEAVEKSGLAFIREANRTVAVKEEMTLHQPLSAEEAAFNFSPPKSGPHPPGGVKTRGK